MIAARLRVSCYRSAMRRAPVGLPNSGQVPRLGRSPGRETAYFFFEEDFLLGTLAPLWRRLKKKAGRTKNIFSPPARQ